MSELSKSIQVRLLKEDETILRGLAKKTGIPFSSLIRLAVQAGVPVVKKSLSTTTKKSV
ncbi:MAG: hypothetical protein RR888_09460 [Akkermansia sp.]